MTIISQQELRAHFVFQSVVVPYFEWVYSELMGPWGQSLLRLEPRDVHTPPSTADLVLRFFHEGKIVVALELRSNSGATRIESLSACASAHSLEQPGDHLTAIWVISNDVRPHG